MVIHSKEVILARDIRGGFLKGIEIEVNEGERENKICEISLYL